LKRGRYEKTRKFTIRIIAALVVILNLSFAVYASENKDTLQHTAISDATLEFTGTTDKSVTRATSPHGVVETKVKAIGSGLVDLETKFASFDGAFNTCNGEHWYYLEDGPFRVATINIYNSVLQSVCYKVDQFTEIVGREIEYCQSEGTVLMNWTYTYNWATVPYNYGATVY